MTQRECSNWENTYGVESGILGGLVVIDISEEVIFGSLVHKEKQMLMIWSQKKIKKNLKDWHNLELMEGSDQGSQRAD